MLLSCTINAQFSSFDLVTGVNSTFRTLSDNSATEDTPLDYRNSQDKRKVNYIVGFNLTADINERVAFKTGLRYTEIGYFTNSYGSCYGFCGLYGSYDNSYFKNKYLEVPLALRIKAEKKSDLTPYIEIGVAPSFLLTQSLGYRQDFANNTRLKNQSYEYSRFHLPATIAIGAEYSFRNQVSFVQIVNKTGLIKTGADYNERFIEVGIEAGIRFNFSTLSKYKKDISKILKNPEKEVAMY